MGLLTIAEQMKAAQELYQLEELAPELAMYYTEGEPFPMIRHPLVYSIMHSPYLNKQMNLMLKHKKERIAELEGRGDYSAIIGYYERPYRLEALLKYAPIMEDRDYWKSLGWIWSDTENFYQNAAMWVAALLSKRPGREFMMDADDKAMYDALPDSVTVYRGQDLKYKTGWSWTTDRAKAEWFATRFNKRGTVLTGTVPKEHVVACLVGRGESEVITNPKSVQLIAKEAV